MTADWDIQVKMSYYKKDLEKNKPIFESICNDMAAMIRGNIEIIDFENGVCIIKVEAKIQTELGTWWDAVFSEYPDLDNSIGIYASGNGIIVWRYKNGSCTYCAWGDDIIVDVAKGIYPESDDESEESEEHEPIEEYDPNGKLIHERTEGGYEQWWEYDANGNLTHVKDNGDYEMWYEYDEAGHKIHDKNIDGTEQWWEYDANGNITHFKDTRGYEVWYEYDVNGNETHTKDSKGFEKWREYNSEGKLIHEKNTLGVDRWIK